ncbi:hypothetical protein Goari_010824, partial [Gossypium aridum]|nr:hypothetical protein [Gossypium aridum]
KLIRARVYTADSASDTEGHGSHTASTAAGNNINSEFYDDAIAIGAFHAAEKGVLVMQSADNSGTAGLQALESTAPWILTFAASTTDHLFVEGYSWEWEDTNCKNYLLIQQRFHWFMGCKQHPIAMRPVLDGRCRCSLRCWCIRINTKYELDDVSFVVPLSAITLSSEDYDSVISYLNST